MHNAQPVILCGGSGARLWPLSRIGFSEQFLCLTGEESLFQQAAKRLTGVGTNEIKVANPLDVTGEEHSLASQVTSTFGGDIVRFDGHYGRSEQ